MVARQVKLTCINFNFKNCCVVDRHGIEGGLALFWSSDVNVNITSYSPSHRCSCVQRRRENVEMHKNLWHLEANKSITLVLC